MQQRDKLISTSTSIIQYIDCMHAICLDIRSCSHAGRLSRPEKHDTVSIRRLGRHNRLGDYR